jgi:hypothetical protein
MRSASCAPIIFPVITSSFARPRPTTAGSREEPPTSGMRPIRVSGMPITASAAMTRRSQASASSIAPPMHAPWMAQIVGFVISSARFQASRHSRRNARRFSAPAASSLSAARSIPEENMGPSPRSTTHWTAGSSAATRRVCPTSRTSAPSNALRFSGRLRNRWRTVPRSSVRTRAMAGP